MNIFDKNYDELPEYSKYMYLNGYSPYEILEAKKRQMEEQAIEEDEQAQAAKLIIEVKKK